MNIVACEICDCFPDIMFCSFVLDPRYVHSSWSLTVGYLYGLRVCHHEHFILNRGTLLKQIYVFPIYHIWFDHWNV